MDIDLDIYNPLAIVTLKRLYKVHINVLKMLDRMGYDISQMAVFKEYVNRNIVLGRLNGLDFLEPNFYKNIESQIPEFFNEGFFRTRQKFSGIYTKKGTEMIVYNTPRDTKNQIAVIYLSSDRGKVVNKKDFRIVDVFVEQYKVRNVIIITENGLNSSRMSYITEQQDGIDFTLFLDVDFAFDRTKHALVPLHTTVTKAVDVPSFEREEDINTKKLPLIIEDDAYAKQLGVKKGDVLTNVVMGTAFEKDIFYELAIAAKRQI